MKLEIPALELQYALNQISQALPTRTTSPVYENILVSVTPDSTRFLASDGMLTLYCDTSAFGVSAIEHGEIAVTGKLFCDVVRKLPNGSVSLTSAKSGGIIIKADQLKSTISARPADDYPVPLIEKDTRTLRISASNLQTMITAVEPCIAAADTTRIALTGGLLEAENDALALVGLDGFRSAACECSLSQSETLRAIVPRRALALIKRLSAQCEDDVELRIGKNTVLARFGNITLISALINGEYPDWRKIFGARTNIEVMVNSKDWRSAIERMCLFARNNTYVKVELEKESLTLSARTEDGDITESISAQNTGEPMTIAFNALYLQDMSRAFTDCEIIMRLSSPLAPICASAREQSQVSMRYLVLPVRIQA